MSSAIFSDCEKYRLRLDRDVSDEGLVACLIGVNPSTADATSNDQTITKDIGFAQRNGWRRIIKVNKFALIATDVTELRQAPDPIGPLNDEHIEQAMIEADVVVPCWGPLNKLPTRLRGRYLDIMAIADKVGRPLYCLGTAKDGHPRHTLMLPYATPLEPWKLWMLA